MSIAFLLLTYGDHIKHEDIKNFLLNGNIYLHPKYKDEVKSYLKDYIIDNIIETKWGDISIVEAEINLLKKSYENIDNKWFILMSSTCYPMIKYQKLLAELNNINLSSFSLNGFTIIDNINVYKSSQFWILKRDDVTTILKYYNKYIIFFKNNISNLKKNNLTPDESFFLTLLMNESSNYNFNDQNITYVKWVYLTSNKHPFTINKLTKYDIIQSDKSYFIRKISSTFTNEIYYNNNKLLILYIDKIENKSNNVNQNNLNQNNLNQNNFNQNNLNKYINNNLIDIILFYSDNALNSIPEKLFSKSIYSMNIYYKIYYETYILFKIKFNDFLSQWKDIKFKKIVL